MLTKYDVIVPSPKKYYVMSIYNHYVHSRKDIRGELTEDIEQLRNAISKVQPDYMESFNKVMKKTSAHMLNMFIMKKEQFDDYCSWLFSILFEIDKHILEYRKNKERVCGAISEMMLDIYIHKNNLKVVERPLIEMEKVSLYKKVINRLKRMF